jgi:hypothetical protein
LDTCEAEPLVLEIAALLVDACERAVRGNASDVNEHYSNGVAEHAVHTVRATAKAMLLHANIPKKYWCYAISLTSLAFPRTARSHASTRSAAISRTKGSASQVSKGHSLASHTIRKHWTTASRTEHAYHAQGTISHSIPTSTLSS